MAAGRLCAGVTAWKSPVRCRLSRSIGPTWLYPPPAAPPLMPNVGPIDGWRMATMARLPMWPSASPRPTVVVVLPSPRGVGVMAETTTYFAFGRSFSSSIASSLILATSLPYGSSRCVPMPILAAMSGIGWSRARRAMSRSLGNVVAAMVPSFYLCVEAGGHLATPSLCRLDLVECEDVHAGHAPVRLRQVGQQRAHEAPGLVAARPEHACQPRRMAAEKPRRVGDADAGRHAQEAHRIRYPVHPDVDWQLHAATPHAVDPSLDGGRGKAQVARSEERRVGKECRSRWSA